MAMFWVGRSRWNWRREGGNLLACWSVSRELGRKNPWPFVGKSGAGPIGGEERIAGLENCNTWEERMVARNIQMALDGVDWLLGSQRWKQSLSSPTASSAITASQRRGEKRANR